MWQEAGALVFLGICAREDIRYRTIPVDAAVAAGALGMLVRMGAGRLTIAGFAGVAALSLLLFLAGCLLSPSVGQGDTLAVAVTGMWIGAGKCLVLALLGMALAAVWGGAGVAAGKYQWKSRLPLIPFFLAADVCRLAAGG